MADLQEKKRYSAKELERIYGQVKPRTIEDPEVRLQKLENSVDVAFLAINELKTELNTIYTIVREIQSPVEIVSAPTTEATKISRRKAVQIIESYISKNPGCRTSEIISDVEIDPNLTLKILRNLRKQGKVRSEKIA